VTIHYIQVWNRYLEERTSNVGKEPQGPNQLGKRAVISKSGVRDGDVAYRVMEGALL
jgi:hypothetical protein